MKVIPLYEARIELMKGPKGDTHCVVLPDRTAVVCTNYASAVRIMRAINGGSREMLSMVY